MKKVLLTIAGLDPTSGAGLTLDLKVFSRLGFYGVAIPTSLTIQNSYRFYQHIPLGPEFILEAYKKLKLDFNFAGLKIGLVGSLKTLPAVEKILQDNQHLPIVVDPVFRASSGYWLFDQKHLNKFIEAIKGRVSLLTPNLPEASLLTGEKIENLKQMKIAAQKIFELAQSPCLIKGGHQAGKSFITDLLFDGQDFTLIRKKKLAEDVHGTGCFLSSAILCYLARGQTLASACQKASQLIDKKLRHPLRISKRTLLNV